MNENTYIVYQAYGSKDVLHELLISIASLYNVVAASRPKIVVYTDSSAYLAQFLPCEVMYIHIPSGQWVEWKGADNFVHRAKIKMLQHACGSLPGAVLYCDTDTCFLKDPMELFQKIQENTFIMHTDEGSLESTRNKVFQKLTRFLSSHKVQGNRIPLTTHMWNAGVLGFTSSDKLVLDEVLALSDALFAMFPKHVMEQLAFSILFSTGRRESCEEAIFHYWDFKEYRIVLQYFFEACKGQPFLVWTAKLPDITPVKLIGHKQAFMRQPAIIRKMKQWIGKGLDYEKMYEEAITTKTNSL